MLTSEFNALSLPEKTALVFAKGKLINITHHKSLQQKSFYYTLNDLKVDVIYDRVRNILLDVIAWENIADRASLLKMPV
jgi:hypothetical protein